MMNIPYLEADLRAHIYAGSLDPALTAYERLLHRKRTPHATICTQLLELCVTRAPRRALYVLESMGEARGLDIDDYCRIVRLFIMQRVTVDELARFEETAIDLLTFSDDSMHNYFAHIATLLNLELHEQVGRPGAGGATDTLDVALLTHKRMVDAAARLCKKGGMVTPIFDLLLFGMGGREGAQDEAEVVRLAEAPPGLATDDKLQAALEQLAASTSLNSSQQEAARACLSRRLTLVQGPPGTGKTKTAVQVVELWVRHLGIRPVLCCADSNVAVDNIGVALVELGLNVVRTGACDRGVEGRDGGGGRAALTSMQAHIAGRSEAVRPELHSRAWRACMHTYKHACAYCRSERGRTPGAALSHDGCAGRPLGHR